ncbi:helix-turn-helix domain-containing protein [Pedococcus sp. NPDC057267]|uniref:helix-turn-helix domain-containing protein n=1 Tax=Pedococcus sp. NPDC057267 TaxID=3346077 RepID=UPI003636E314
MLVKRFNMIDNTCETCHRPAEEQIMDPEHLALSDQAEPEVHPVTVGRHTPSDQTIAEIGARIRGLRNRRGQTLKDLATETGVSVSMLSMLERGVASASIGTLVSVASALGVHMYDLFDRPAPLDVSPVTRLEDQAVGVTREGAARRVALYDAVSGVELAINTYAAGSASSPAPTHHRGREFGVVIAGRLEVELGGEVHRLEPGDAVAYPSTSPHRIHNPSVEESIAVWINLDGG